MRLKRFTDLGLRVLIYLAQRQQADPGVEPGLVSIAELAEKLAWNKNHVVKVAHFMVKAGWLDTVRGRNGGLRLSMMPSAYRIGDVVRKLEGEEHLIDCAEPPCPFKSSCGLIHALAQAQEVFYARLNTHTLQAIVEHPDLTVSTVHFVHKPHPADPVA